MQSVIHHAFVHPAGYRELVAVHADAIRGQARIIDVREPGEFVGPLGHITGAELVPLATLPEAAAAWDRGQPLLVVCRSGGRSGKAAAFLVAAGFTRVINLAGGMIAWTEHRLGTCAGEQPCGCRTDAR